MNTADRRRLRSEFYNKHKDLIEKIRLIDSRMSYLTDEGKMLISLARNELRYSKRLASSSILHSILNIKH